MSGPITARIAAGWLAGTVLATLPATGAAAEPGRGPALARPATRIVSLAPHLTELLFVAGAGDRLVGVVAYSDYPDAARALPRIGDTHALDLERIRGLAPDLVIAWESGNPPAALARLAGLGIPVLLQEPGSLDDVPATLERLGHLAGTQATAGAAADALRRRIAHLRARFAARAPLRVFYQVWDAPLVTVGGRHVISDALKACGAENVFGSLAALAPTITPEAVLVKDPDVIVAGVAIGDTERALRPWRRWTGLRAVRARALLSVPADTMHRFGPRMVDAAEQLCEALDRVRARTGH